VLALAVLAARAGAAELTEADLDAGRRPAIGDSVVLQDFSRCTPATAVVGQSEKGKWWLRPYRTASGATGKMLCVEARDKENPQTCVAPELTYPLQLDGVYEIWVGTYQPLFGGGIDIRLSGDKVYGTIDPQEAPIRQWPLPQDQYGTLVQVLFKTADLTGQQILVRQPHGTYQSLWWGLCNAHLATIRLVRRDAEEVKQAAGGAAQTAQEGHHPRPRWLQPRVVLGHRSARLHSPTGRAVRSGQRRRAQLVHRRLDGNQLPPSHDQEPHRHQRAPGRSPRYQGLR
jgi:hypothetical protein